MPLELNLNHINTKIIGDPDYVQQVSLLLSRLNIDIKAYIHTNNLDDYHKLIAKQQSFSHDISAILKPYNISDNLSPIETKMTVSYTNVIYDDSGSILYGLITRPIAGSKADLAMVRKQLAPFVETNHVVFRLVPASTNLAYHNIDMEIATQDTLTKLFDTIMKSSQKNIIITELLMLNPKLFSDQYFNIPLSQTPVLSKMINQTFPNQIDFIRIMACKELQQILQHMLQN